MSIPPNDLRSLTDTALRAQQEFRSRWEPFVTDPTLALPAGTMESVLEELAGRLNDNYPFFHPRYAGQMLKPPHPIAVAAYLTAMQINPNNHALDGGPATAKMELEAVRSLAAMFGYTDHLGHLTSSGTIANLEALWVARCIHPERAVAFSPNAHYTHRRMCEVLRVPSVEIDVTDLDALEKLFQQGTVGTLVVTIGTTGTGSVEPLHRILPIARKYGVRIHADCAYGGFFTLLAQGDAPTVEPAPFLALRECDSIVIDPHKHGLQPYGCGCVLFRDPSVGSYYKHDSPYTYFTSAELHLGEISLECSRAGASAAALWATLRALPLEPERGFGPILRKCRAAALAMDAAIVHSPRWERYTEPALDIVTYFPRPKQFTASEVSRISERIFSESMKNSTHPLYLAAYTVESSAIAAEYPQFISDQPSTRILRSVLMKPEHLDFVPQLMSELDKIVDSIL
ncbi:MAG: aspartate aminotransferase family protein [Bacteroidetes bacterium]|nr:aspartate aminotransferase family protein [Bacteroidota bacterium]